MGWGVTTVEPGSSFGNIIRQRGWFLIAGGCLPPKGLGDRGRMGGQGSHWEGVYYPGEKFPHFSFLIWVPALHCLIALARILCKIFFLGLFLFLFNSCIHGIWKFPGQGLNPSLTCDLRCSCSTAGCFNLVCWASDQTLASTVT